jgi:YHYH protein
VSQRRDGCGARHAGDWIQGSTWDATRKIWVQGNVLWPDARFNIETTANQRVLTGNALPVGHATGTFPIARTDPAFAIDTNPNAIAVQTLTFALPLQPTPAASAGCVPMGVIGVAVNGVPIFNALDDAGRDAVAHEVQDRCHGHPQGRGVYHYHGPSDCVPGSTENSVLVGYALDGFGIYSHHDDSGREITNADLDECHGRVGPVLWNGQRISIYHYVMTREYPYTLGCYRGNPVRGRMQARAGADGRPRDGRRSGGP